MIYFFKLFLSFSGDLWQLPPIYDNLVTENNHLDGRPACAPSHWNENFKVFYLTKKMRSQKDPLFSDLCDRVGRGTITIEDEDYLRSRVQSTESENCNENFKNGSLSIIVTTNKKRNIVNIKKLAQLIPNEKQYKCNSTDRLTNLPGNPNIPENIKDNPAKTGNLSTELILKVGAPVVITTNHSKQKYREDGIVNGARGFVQSIQVSKQDQENVEVIWVVFNKESIGKLYRFEHKFLKKHHNPGHELATPIFPHKRKFTLKFGNVEYQRTNFPLSLAYAITAHKCQGETLEEVIIDFGPEVVNKIKVRNYICTGSFYVALTRVRMGIKVFLRSFDKSYILANKSIEEKVEAMRKFRQYNFKKIYLDERIFEIEGAEIKLGYLNINGLMVGNHAEYLNEDHNLKHLDILVLAETKLNSNDHSDQISKILTNWNIIARYDAEDALKHMGLMLLKSEKSSIHNKMHSITHQTAKRNEKLQVQGLIVRLKDKQNFGFIYCRSTPSNPEIKAICKYFNECEILMGDFNLSHRISEDQEKIVKLCQEEKINALIEITRSASNNQLDYILINKNLIYFVTSYSNFISDHKSIVARVGAKNNKLTEDIKGRITFTQDLHLKVKKGNEKETRPKNQQAQESFNKDHITDSDESSENNDPFQEKQLDQNNDANNQSFRRHFKNIDMATCWLNSCLQLILTAMDHTSSSTDFTSELGKELLFLHNSEQNKSLNPTTIKNIVVTAEDTRIATRLSELAADIDDQDQLATQSRAIENLRLNLISGQQCVRDFFLCLEENLINWPDVYACFGFKLTHSTICCSCNHGNQSQTTQMYVEIPVPQDNSNLNDKVEEQLNTSTLVGLHCENLCEKFVQAEKSSKLTSVADTEFLIVVLTRGVETIDGFQMNRNRTVPTNDVLIR